jgi:vitamin B12 transporter
MDGYLLFNLLATYSIARNWSLELRWNNVFNEQYELAKGYNTPSSNVFVSVQYTLQ